jgi:protein involved in polysaccharide export with SLBB domain
MFEISFVKPLGLLTVLVGLLLGVSGCQNSPPARDPNLGAMDGGGNRGVRTNAPSVGKELQFRPGDSIKIEFSDTELKPVETEIKHDGVISLELVDQIKVSNKTPREVEQEIKALYVPKFYKRLTVTVTPGTRFFYVGGEVKQENRFAYSGRITLLKAIQSAGGFTNFANKRAVRVIRASGEVILVDCVAALSDPSLDIEIYPNDQINVKATIL